MGQPRDNKKTGWAPVEASQYPCLQTAEHAYLSRHRCDFFLREIGLVTEQFPDRTRKFLSEAVPEVVQNVRLFAYMGEYRGFWVKKVLAVRTLEPAASQGYQAYITPKPLPAWERMVLPLEGIGARCKGSGIRYEFRISVGI